MNDKEKSCRVGIAIVEDEKDLVKAYERLFAKKGITICFIAYDGVEAVNKYLQCTPKPHVVIMDYRLPIMNGIEATRKILEIDPQARVIFLSADIGVKEEAMETGAYIFLKKPASLMDIVAAVKSATERSPAATVKSATGGP